MKTFTSVTIAGALASIVSAQYQIDPTTVDDPTKQYWCQQQQTECPLICLQMPDASGEPISNTCDWSSLTYSCVCSNNQSPNVTEYSQTLPYFICSEWGNQCVSNCNGDSTCAADCRDNHPCGALNPTRQNTSTLTSTMSRSTTGAAADAGATTDSQGQTIYTGFAGGDGASQTGGSGGGGGGGDGSGAASTIVRVWALSAGQTFGSILAFGSITLGFALFL